MTEIDFPTNGGRLQFPVRDISGQETSFDLVCAIACVGCFHGDDLQSGRSKGFECFSVPV